VAVTLGDAEKCHDQYDDTDPEVRLHHEGPRVTAPGQLGTAQDQRIGEHDQDRHHPVKPAGFIAVAFSSGRFAHGQVSWSVFVIWRGAITAAALS
jgi:hypothetical protein